MAKTKRKKKAELSFEDEMDLLLVAASVATEGFDKLEYCELMDRLSKCDPVRPVRGGQWIRHPAKEIVECGLLHRMIREAHPLAEAAYAVHMNQLVLVGSDDGTAERKWYWTAFPVKWLQMKWLQTAATSRTCYRKIDAWAHMAVAIRRLSPEQQFLAMSGRLAEGEP